MSTKIVTPVATLSFPRVKLPKKNDEGVEKYEGAFAFSQEAQKTPEYKALKQAMIDAAKEEFGDKGVEMLRKGELRNPFKTDGEAKGYGKGSTYINARSNNQPQCVTRIKGKDGKPTVVPQDELDKYFYPGAQVKALVSAFYYNKKGKGISFGLEGLQFFDHGERLDNRVNAQDAFDADDAGAADLSDLEDGGSEDGNSAIDDLLA